MTTKQLMKGCEAIAEAALRGGCRYFFGYPITPQNDIPEYMSARLPEIGGVFLQAESEVAASNMVYGAAGAGAKVMTSSSSPGISLKSEGLSYIAACDLPALVVNVQRGGPGRGGIQPSQSDYFQAVTGGSHGDMRKIVERILSAIGEGEEDGAPEREGAMSAQPGGGASKQKGGEPKLLKEYARKYDFHRFSRRVELTSRRARVDYVINRNEAGFPANLGGTALIRRPGISRGFLFFSEES